MITCPLKRSRMTFGDAAMESSLLLRQEIHETRPTSSSSIHAVKVAPASVTCGTKTYFKLYVHLLMCISFPILVIIPSSSPLGTRDSLILRLAQLSLLPGHSSRQGITANITLAGRGKPQTLQSICCPLSCLVMDYSSCSSLLFKHATSYFALFAPSSAGQRDGRRGKTERRDRVTGDDDHADDQDGRE